MNGKAEGSDRAGIAAAAALFFMLALIGSANAFSTVEKQWPHATYYTVVARPGDTLARVALRYRASISAIGRLNTLDSMSRIHAGRVLRIPAATSGTREAVLSEAVDHSVQNYAPPPAMFGRVGDVRRSPAGHEASIAHYRTAQYGTGQQFLWPLDGTVISSFGAGEHGGRNDGINIAAERGMSFRAAAPGRVCYTGALRGYGNLILITHPNGYVTAYAHAENIAVARGDEVGRGQVIGTAGITGGVDRPQLHFEIRRGITPVDPTLLLAARI